MHTLSLPEATELLLHINFYYLSIQKKNNNKKTKTTCHEDKF